MNRQTVILTAPQHYALRLACALEAYSDRFETVVVPMVCSSVTTGNKAAIKEFWRHRSHFDAAAFMSRKAIEACKGHPWHTESNLAFLAIGKDNEALRESLYVEPAFVASEASPMGIAHEWQKRGDAQGKRMAVLAPLFDGLEEPLTVPDFIQKATSLGMETTRINVYTNSPTPLAHRLLAYEMLARQEAHILALTSGSEAVAFCTGMKAVYGNGALDMANRAIVACMGPYTAQQARRSGLEVDMVASQHSSFHDFARCMAEFTCGHPTKVNCVKFTTGFSAGFTRKIEK